MKIPAILNREPLSVEAGVSRLAKVRLARLPWPVLLKEPAHFWDADYLANEAARLREITHPRVRRLLAYDAATHQLLLEYIEGATFYDLVKGGITQLDPGRTHQILQNVAETLADLHAGIFCERPLVHNDLKSMNVLVPAAAPRESVLIDFTHAYPEGQVPPFIAGQQHNPVGTAKYMAPEKWDGNYEHGAKSDVFAFGVLAYFAYTGKAPFEGAPGQIEKQIREVTPPTPIYLGVNVLRNIQAAVMACLEKDPARRPSMDYVARCYAESASLFP